MFIKKEGDQLLIQWKTGKGVVPLRPPQKKRKLFTVNKEYLYYNFLHHVLSWLTGVGVKGMIPFSRKVKVVFIG